VSSPATTGQRTDYLDVAAKSAAIAAALLPALGVLVRFVAFQPDPEIPSAVSLAPNEAFSMLVVSGVIAVVFSAMFLALIYLGLYIAGRLGGKREAQDPGATEGVFARIHRQLERLPLWAQWVVGLVVAGAVLYYYVSGPAWPSALVIFLSSTTTFAILRWLAVRHGRLTVVHVLPVIVLNMTAAGVASGLDGLVAGVERGEYTFAGVELRNGPYVRLGEAGDFVFLKACTPASRLLAVKRSAILMVQFPLPPRHPEQPSLWEAIRLRTPTRVGLRPCMS
jgi:hypothetical protein